MDILDIFTVHPDGKGFTVNATSFVPNADDEEVKQLMDKITENLENRTVGIANLTTKEFAQCRNQLIKGLQDDTCCVKVIFNELMELRKITRQIQEERDVLLKFATEAAKTSYCPKDN